MIIWSALRAAASTAALVALYYLLPLDTSVTWAGVTTLVIGLIVLIVLVVFQVRRILTSPFPGLRAVEALATSIPLFLLLFASTYVVMGKMSGSNFSEPLTRTDALYFTVTVFTTVGFGDITPKTQAARLVVTAQMIANLVILGLAIKVIVGAVQQRRSARPLPDALPAAPQPNPEPSSRRAKPAQRPHASRTAHPPDVRPLCDSMITGWACDLGAALRAARLRRSTAPPPALARGHGRESTP